MKLGNLAGGVCRICGSDTYGADIGCSCRGMYYRAKFIALKNHNEDSLEYNYGIDMKYWMDKFVSEYEVKLKKHGNDLNKTFRSEFKKSFYPSVVEFYKSKGFVSKKQLDIVKRELFKESDYLLAENYNIIEKKKEEFLNSFSSKCDLEIVEIARNLWKQKKTK